MAATKGYKMRFGEEKMRSHDYFRKISETSAAQAEKKIDAAILAARVQKYLATPGKTITLVPRGMSGVVLSPMGICRNGIKGAQK